MPAPREEAPWTPWSGASFELVFLRSAPNEARRQEAREADDLSVACGSRGQDVTWASALGAWSLGVDEACWRDARDVPKLQWRGDARPVSCRLRVVAAPGHGLGAKAGRGRREEAARPALRSLRVLAEEFRERRDKARCGQGPAVVDGPAPRSLDVVVDQRRTSPEHAGRGVGASCRERPRRDDAERPSLRPLAVLAEEFQRRREEARRRAALPASSMSLAP